jgi:NADH:ubiquinone reductase (H+-translocating)
VTRGEPEPFDVCIWTVGFVGAPLPVGLPLATNARGQVLVDPFLRSVSHPAVYVAGDLAAHAQAPAVPVPMGCKSAGPGGAHVADNVMAELRGRPLAIFDFAAPIYCVSLGRHDGIVQRTTADGSLSGPILRGRLGAWVKEAICKSTITAFTLERFGLSSYAVFRAGNVPVLPAATTESAVHGSFESKAVGS